MTDFRGESGTWDPTPERGVSSPDAGGGYPPPGTLGGRLFEMSEEEFEHRFELAYANFEPDEAAIEAGVDAEAMRRLEDFVRHHKEILEGERSESDRIAAPTASFRPVPSARTFGMLRWYDPETVTVLGAHFPPLHGTPASVAIGFPLPPDRDPIERLAELGFRAPERDPTFIFGELTHREGKTLIYAPAPEGLAELVYRIRRSPDGWDVLLTAECPPEPRFSELVEAYRKAFSWQGSLQYDNLEDVLTREGAITPDDAVKKGGELVSPSEGASGATGGEEADEGEEEGDR